MTDASPPPPALDSTRDDDAGLIPRKRVVAWAMWDWATQPFNSVIVTFVFIALYLASDSFIDPAIVALGENAPEYEAAIATLTSRIGWAVTIAGVLVALIAPVLGQRADTMGRRKAWLGWCTLALVGCMVALFFVEARPSFFLLGASLIAVGAVFNEVASVNYNAMLVQVSTKKSVGRVSGLGWGLGYVGGIIALVIVVVADGASWWGMDTSNGMAYRLIAVGCAVWTLLFAWPIFVFVPEVPASTRKAESIWRGYAVLAHDLKELWAKARSTLWFLVASAVYRDGLAGIFTFGAIIAAKSFGFSNQSVIIFGIAANLIAGASTIIAGRFDDRLGPRAVILFALGGIIISGLAVVVFHSGGTAVFWVFGLILTAFVGPAQAASRSLLARVCPPGREGEVFGLYATTGRAASFLAPGMWALTIALTGATIWGVLGIIAVVIAGMIMLLFVKVPVPGRV